MYWDGNHLNHFPQRVSLIIWRNGSGHAAPGRVWECSRPTSNLSGERHGHQRQDGTMKTELAGTDLRNEQCLKGLPHHGLLAPAIL